MAGTKDCYPSDDDVARIIRIKAKTLARELRAGNQYREDFEQEFWLHYSGVRDHYDPERGRWSTFLDRVFKNKGFNMMAEWRTRKRRSERKARRWDDRTGSDDDDALTLEEVYGDDDHHAETGWGPQPDRQTVDLRLDVGRVLRGLPADLRELARRLMQQSVSEAAREMKIPRSTLYGKIHRIAKILRAAGVDDGPDFIKEEKRKN